MNSTSSNPKVRHSQLLLQTFDLLRFPLALMVVFVHQVPEITPIPNVDFPMLSMQGIYNLLAIIFSKILPLVAVPTFYLISGYLFFFTMQNWSWQKYKTKIEHRVHSLAIPYFLWNSIGYAFLIAVAVSFRLYSHLPLTDIDYLFTADWWHIYFDYYTWDKDLINWLGGHLYLTGPYDTPLWFVRDLFMMALISPVIYLYVKHLKEWGMLLLLVAYVSKIWILTPGFSITAVFFFSLGAYLTLHQRDVIRAVHSHKTMLLLLTFVTLVLSVYYNGIFTSLAISISSLFCVFGAFTAILFASMLMVRRHVRPNKLLVSACFFIYAMHYIGDLFCPIHISNKILHAIIPGNTDAEYIVCYLFTPFLTVALILAFYIVLRKLSPKVAHILSGR